MIQKPNQRIKAAKDATADLGKKIVAKQNRLAKRKKAGEKAKAFFKKIKDAFDKSIEHTKHVAAERREKRSSQSKPEKVKRHKAAAAKQMREVEKDIAELNKIHKLPDAPDTAPLKEAAKKIEVYKDTTDKGELKAAEEILAAYVKDFDVDAGGKGGISSGVALYIVIALIVLLILK